MVRAVMKASFFGVVAVAGALAGCKVEISLGCEDSGSQYATDETFTRDCQTCTCGADGTVSCTDNACVEGCDYNGQIIPVGTTVDAGDNCNTCTCAEGGVLGCTTKACPVCAGEPIVCPQPNNGCVATPVCDDTGNWNCILSCECDPTMVPECPSPPDGCFYTGPVCVDGLWDCGEEVCQCDEPPPVCDPTGDPNCFTYAECDQGMWTCIQSCPCDEPAPDCPPDTVAVCDPANGWTCEPVNQTCPDVGMIDCGPPPIPECTVSSYCHEDGQWFCQEECPIEFCMDPEPTCPDGQPNCAFYPVCTVTSGWVCAESCI